MQNDFQFSEPLDRLLRQVQTLLQNISHHFKTTKLATVTSFCKYHSYSQRYVSLLPARPRHVHGRASHIWEEMKINELALHMENIEHNNVLLL